MAGLFKKLGKGIMFIFILPLGSRFSFVYNIRNRGFFFKIRNSLIYGEKCIIANRLILQKHKLAEQKASHLRNLSPIVQPQTTIILMHPGPTKRRNTHYFC